MVSKLSNSIEDKTFKSPNYSYKTLHPIAVATDITPSYNKLKENCKPIDKI